MILSETHHQFFQVLNRLKQLDWNKQFSVLKPPEYIALTIIDEYHRSHPDVSGIYVSDFAERLHVAPPTASKLLKQMEGEGWLCRMVDRNNRRNTFISLTAAGKELLTSEQEHCAALGNRVIQRMGKENSAALLAGLNHMIDLIEEEFEAKHK